MDSIANAKERLQQALRDPDPGEAVWKLAHALRDEGMAQMDLYFLYSDAHILSEEERLYEALADTMDIIWGGGWAKGGGLYPQELTNEMVKVAERKRDEKGGG